MKANKIVTIAMRCYTGSNILVKFLNDLGMKAQRNNQNINTGKGRWIKSKRYIKYK